MSGGNKRSRTRRAVNLGTFCSGLALILAATILNVAYDRMDSPAPHISDLYETFGKFGVTLTLVSAGLSIILVGVAMGGQRRSKSRGRSESDVVERLFAFGGVGAGSGAGEIELSTRKYLTPARGQRVPPPTPALAALNQPVAEETYNEPAPRETNYDPAPVAEVIDEPSTGLTAEAEPLPDEAVGSKAR